MSTPGTPTSGSKAIPKWKQLQIEQQELAAKRKREEAEAKAKKLQESGLFVVPSSPASSSGSNISTSDSPSSTPKWKLIQIENEKHAAERRREQLEAKQKALSPFKMSGETPLAQTSTTNDTSASGPAGGGGIKSIDSTNRSNTAVAAAAAANTTEPAATPAADVTSTSNGAKPGLAASPRAPSIPTSDGAVIYTTTRSVEPLDDGSAKSQTTHQTVPMTQSIENAAEDEVVEAAMVEVVHMYAGIDDDENADNARQGGNGDAGSRSSGSQSTSSSSSDSDSDGDADEGVDADLRRPPKDVSDSGLVPVMPRSACVTAAAHVTARDIVQSPSLRLRVGYAETQGVRRSMEDRMTVFGRLLGCDTADYFGIFDGHGGDATAHYVGEQLHHVLYEHIKKTVNAGSDDPTLNFAMALEDAQGLRKAFTSGFEDLQAQLEAKQPPLAGGAVGVAALILGDQLFLANCGDARAVLVRSDGSATRLSLDHKPHLPAEKARIEGLGGFVTTHTSRQGVVTSRVCGAISVSRAFGDVGLQPYLVATPFVSEPVSVAATDGSASAAALLLACDGLFDVITDEAAAKMIVDTRNPEKAAIKLRDAAYAGGSTDNISVLVIHLPAFVAKYPAKIEEHLRTAHPS